MTTLSPSRPRVRPGRLALWAGFAVALTALNLRTAVTGFTPLLETVGADLGFGVAVAGLLGTVPAASFAVFGFLAPAVTRRFGLERTATVALGLTALSLVLRAPSPTTTVLVLSTVLALAGIGAANVVIVPLVKAWFSDRLALWTSLYLLLMQTGQFVAPLLAVPVAEASSWRLSVGLWAGPAAVAAVVWLLLALRLPSPTTRPHPSRRPARPGGPVVHRVGPRRPLRHDVAVELRDHHVGAGGPHRTPGAARRSAVPWSRCTRRGACSRRWWCPRSPPG